MCWSFILQAEISTVSTVDLQRYQGKWYEVARYPNKHQAECKPGTSTAEYSLNKKGTLDIINRCIKLTGQDYVAKGISRIKDPQEKAKLQVNFAPSFIRFFGIGWGNYWIIMLDPNYQYAVVSEPTESPKEANYLWVLSRDEKMAQATFDTIKSFLIEKGYDISRLMVNPAMQANK